MGQEWFWMSIPAMVAVSNWKICFAIDIGCFLRESGKPNHPPAALQCPSGAAIRGFSGMRCANSSDSQGRGQGALAVLLGCWPPPERLFFVIMHEVTRILSAIEQGEPHAAKQLLPLVYLELRKLAAH